MELFFEIISTVFPSIIILIIVYLMMSGFMDNEDKRRRAELRRERSKQSLPVRLQAHERLALFLERISPNSLMVRVNAEQLSNAAYLNMMKDQIRTEFEHNLSQQIYVAEPVWETVVIAKSAMVSLLNTTSAELGAEASGAELAEAVLLASMAMEKFPTKVALVKLRASIAAEF
ncbi:MAG: hypothetical protein HOE88_06655 [Flavobacteriales bacterium]|jgi:hypothetical protein|nr:hypothetical protein [Flavobacteriales bacterium]MBT3572223.1 hypothetical protein [Flavobacteriales bacterium]MBT3678622.1 hypothetical protein [Flavobacteriales bacterium]MBT3739688.1 hypothetical protein [Flavobacteriales bacterium]MBT4103044.1 hypothetical protein [Flavobacteriales bacterium]